MLAHSRAGEGPRPIVLLHGLLGSARNVSGLARALATAEPSFSIFMLDLTGHGASPPLPAGADLATLAHDVLTTVDALGLGSPLHLLGHSLGGRVALRAAEVAPGRLERLTLLDIGPSPLAHENEGIETLLAALLSAPASAASRDVFRAHFRAAGLPRAMTDWVLLNLVGEATGFRWRIDRPAVVELHRRAAAEDLWPVVESAHPYALRCIRGGRSPFVSEQDARRLLAAGCRVDTLAGAGHFLHVDRPRALVDLVLGP